MTGEGSLDAQSLHGKAPIGVVRRARQAGVPVTAVCGRSTLSPAQVAEVGLVGVHALSDLEPDPVVSMRDAADLLVEVGARLGTSLRRSSTGVR